MQTGQENPLKAFVYFSKITLSLGKAIANQKAYIMANLMSSSTRSSSQPTTRYPLSKLPMPMPTKGVTLSIMSNFSKYP